MHATLLKRTPNPPVPKHVVGTNCCADSNARTLAELHHHILVLDVSNLARCSPMADRCRVFDYGAKLL